HPPTHPGPPPPRESCAVAGSEERLHRDPPTPIREWPGRGAGPVFPIVHRLKVPESWKGPPFLFDTAAPGRAAPGWPRKLPCDRANPPTQPRTVIGPPCAPEARKPLG